MGRQRRRGDALTSAASAAARAATVCLLLAAAAPPLAAAAAPSPPLLQMAQPALHLPPVPGANSSEAGSADGQAGVLIGVQLVGAAQRAVSAQLAVLLPAGAAAPQARAQRNANGVGSWQPADPSQLWLEPGSLRWDSGEAGVKWVRVRSAAELPLALLLNSSLADGLAGGGIGGRSGSAAKASQQQAVLRVHLAGASGASIAAAPLSSTELLLAGGNATAAGGSAKNGSSPAGALPLFGFVANQAAYPPAGKKSSGQASIPVTLLAGRLAAPATLRYQLRLLPPAPARPGEPSPKPFLPAKAMQGFLTFKPAGNGSGNGSGSGEQQQGPVEQRIVLPLAWDRIPPAAEYRLGLELEGVFGARVAPQASAVALHVFGTPLGTCPPGSALQHSGNGSDTAGAAPQGRRPTAGGDAEPPMGASGSAGFLLSPNGTVIDLSSSLLPGVHDYGAMVEPDVEEVTMCMRVGAADEPLAGMVTALAAAGQPRGLALQPAPASVAEEACGCVGTGEDAAGEGEDGEAAFNDCQYEAWVLPLRPGQNVFNVTAWMPGEAAVPAPATAPNAAQRAADLSPSLNGSTPHRASLAVVRLADPEHAELLSLTARTADDTAVELCGPSATISPHVFNRGVPSLQLPKTKQRCKPGVLLTLNVSDASRMVSLTPALKFPEVPGVRVEVNGQVLSRGGDVAADQLQDTTAAVASARQPSNGTFLPSAFILGLQPGGRVDVEVVVVAEDGVTTFRYPLQFVLVRSEQQLTVAEASMLEEPGNGAIGSGAAAPDEVAGGRRSGWPLSPAQHRNCSICPAGWAADKVNASECSMCPPGTFAPYPQSSACQPCPAGKFAYTWGSSYCKNCIEGTYAPRGRSSLCLACPDNSSTLADGAAACVPSSPGNYTAPRFAVVVSFYVNLCGLELEDVVVRAGVNGDPQAIVSSLIRSDTALAFNISRDNVQVVAMRRVARRVLSANVTALLGVEVPPGATDAEIAAALEVEQLSADKPIEMLSSDPDRFFNRTAATLEVQVESGMHGPLSTVQPSRAGLLWAMLAPGIVTVLVGSALVTAGCRRSKACARWRTSAARRLATTRLAPAQVRYARYAGSSSAPAGPAAAAAAGEGERAPAD